MAEPRISLSPPLMMEGRRRVGRRSHARPECCLRLIEATAAPPLRPSVAPGRAIRPEGLAAAPRVRQSACGEGRPMSAYSGNSRL